MKKIISVSLLLLILVVTCASAQTRRELDRDPNYDKMYDGNLALFGRFVENDDYVAYLFQGDKLIAYGLSPNTSVAVLLDNVLSTASYVERIDNLLVFKNRQGQYIGLFLVDKLQPVRFMIFYFVNLK